MTDEVDRSVVLALLQVAFLGKCDDGLGPRGWPFSRLPDLVADCCDRCTICLEPRAIKGSLSKPGDCQSTAMHVSPTARNSAYQISAIPVH